MSIIQTSDFKGEYKVAQDCYSDLSGYIEKYEKKYLQMILGAELYLLFIADLTVDTPQTPQTQRFIDIFNEFQTTDNGCLVYSEGIKKMLIQFIYFHITRDIPNAKTSTGTVMMANENSISNPYNGFGLVETYNEAVANSRAIQWYVYDNDDIYPEEQMQLIDFMSGI